MREGGAVGRAGHGEVVLGGHGGSAAAANGAEGDSGGARKRERVKEHRKDHASLGARAIALSCNGGGQFRRGGELTGGEQEKERRGERRWYWLKWTWPSSPGFPAPA